MHHIITWGESRPLMSFNEGRPACVVQAEWMTQRDAGDGARREQRRDLGSTK